VAAADAGSAGPVALTKTVTSATFAGPLPPPGALAAYEQIHPGSADRIIRMAEAQSGHRQDLERHVIQGNVTAQARGQWFAFILGAIAIGGGVGLAATGHSLEGLASLVTAVTALAGVFIYGQHQQAKERAQKREASTSEEIQKLGALRGEGLLTEDEFTAQKQKLLNP